MSKTLKVLSIDYDYFVDANESQVLNLFPDSIDLSPSLSAQVWDTHYMIHGDEIRSIGLRSDEYDKMINRLKNEITSDLCVFSYTHKDIVQCIEDLTRDCAVDKIIINHIDTHPDTGPLISDKFNCGNWVTYLKDKYDSVGIRWISNVNLFMIQRVNGELLSNIKFGIDKLTHIKHYDLIFLCRSDQWVPPHLDQKFADMVYAVRDARSMGIVASLEPRKLNY